MKHLKIYTDGACSGNPGPGGWAIVVEPEKPDQVISEYHAQRSDEWTTNNEMELAALVYAVDVADWLMHKAKVKAGEGKVTIYTDSMYCLKCAKGEWKRKAHIWRWDTFDIFMEGLKNRGIEVEFEWVKAHAGNKLNVLADELARAVINTHIESTV